MTDQLAAALDEPDAVTHLDLAAEFPAATRDEWRRLVTKVLGDAVTDETAAAPERLLASELQGGIEVMPLYTADDGVPDAGYPGEMPFVRGSDTGGNRDGWDARSRHGHPDASVAHDQVMADLDGGVTSLWLALGDGRTPVAELDDVLAGVYLDLVTVVLDAGEQGTASAEAFFAIAERRGVSAADLRVTLGADPIGLTARTGAGGDIAAAVALAARCAAGYPRARAFVVDALPYHDAGASDADELGCAVATGVAYLRAMQQAGMSADAAFGQLEFRYAATADEFATIAKLRAARRVWSQVAQSCGVGGPVAGQRQHAVTSWPMLTRRDPWNNMLRATLAAFAAGVGGADAVTVLPFDAALGHPDELGRRIARNTHALLVDESSVARVIDPAGGSWYVESLTEAMAERAWEWFQAIEAGGGMAAVLTAGLVRDRVAASRKARRAALARREEAITGVSEFPLLGEKLLTRAPDSFVEPGGGLPRIRWSQWHEQLRDRSDTFADSTGAPPTVALVSVGAAAASAQADRVGSVLAAAGVVVVPAAIGELTGQQLASPVAFVAAADGVAPAEVEAAAVALRAAGAEYVVLAGALPVAGTDECLEAGTDALALSSRVLDAIGVAP